MKSQYRSALASLFRGRYTPSVSMFILNTIISFPVNILMGTRFSIVHIYICIYEVYLLCFCHYYRFILCCVSMFVGFWVCFFVFFCFFSESFIIFIYGRKWITIHDFLNRRFLLFLVWFVLNDSCSGYLFWLVYWYFESQDMYFFFLNYVCIQIQCHLSY